MKYTKNNPKFIVSPNEIDNLEMRDWFKFTCIKCGATQIKQVNTKSKIPTHKKMLCTYCLTHIDHYTKSNPKRITTFEELKQLHKYDSFIFKCKKCNELYLVSSFRKERINNYKDFLCLSCFRSEFRKQHPEIVKKSMETIRKNHGGLHNSQTPEGRNLMRLRNLKHPEWCQNNKFKYKYLDGSKFDSAWELALWIYAKDHNEEIIREPVAYKYTYDGKTRLYFPDFLYNNKIIEIKGNQYYLNRDTNNRMIFPYTRLHKNSPELTPEEKQYMDDLYETKHQCGLINGVEFWNKKECEPFVKYVEDKYGIEYLPSFKIK